jgi:hypothetical protein
VQGGSDKSPARFVLTGLSSYTASAPLNTPSSNHRLSQATPPAMSIPELYRLTASQALELIRSNKISVEQ